MFKTDGVYRNIELILWTDARFEVPPVCVITMTANSIFGLLVQCTLPVQLHCYVYPSLGSLEYIHLLVS